MLPLTPDDHALIAQARDAIRRNYDGVHENHTVGAAVRCADGTLVKILARKLLPFAYHSEDA